MKQEIYILCCSFYFISCYSDSELSRDDFVRGVFFLILHVRSAVIAPEVPLVAQQGSYVAIVLALEPHKR